MKKIVCILFILQCAGTVSSQTKDYSKIDAYAKATPESKTVSVESLAKYLALPAKNDSDKVRSIFIWITSHVKYDWDAYENQTAMFQDPEVTLSKRVGVCQNISDLFTALCKAAGLEVNTIGGYAKSGYDNSWMLDGFTVENHAWNVVKVAGRWQLMDVTWAQNTGSDFYFMADPIVFRSNHLPGDAAWQLARDTMTLEQYSNAPVFEAAFDELSITHLTPTTCSVKGKMKVVFEFDSPKAIALHAEVKIFESNSAVSSSVVTQSTTHTGNHYQLVLTFHKAEKYLVTLGGLSYFDPIATYAIDTHTVVTGSR